MRGLLTRLSILAPVEKSISDVITTSITSTYHFRGVNQPRTDNNIYFYIVDQESLRRDNRTCGNADDDFSVPVDQRDICYRVRILRDNCAVIAGNTIACDFSLIWRLSRDASLLAISSLKKPNVNEYYFPRENTRLKFLSGEKKYITREQRIGNLKDIDDVFTNGLLSTVRDTRERVLNGFVFFLIGHELGHVVLGHSTNSALPHCALAIDNLKGSLANYCQSSSKEESDADDFAINLLARDISPDAFTPARAAPEFFVEEFERRRYQTIADLGFNPQTWAYDSANSGDKAAYDSKFVSYISTGSHPKDMQRYVSLLSLLERKGVVLTASKEKKLIATEMMSRLDAYCNTANLNK